MKELKISKRTIFIIIGGIILLAAAFVATPHLGADEESGDNSEINYDKLNDVVFTVKTDIVKRGTLTLSVSGNGIVKPAKELDVVPNNSGYITQISITEGKRVSKGDLLIKLDDTEQQIAMNDARVEITNAKIEYRFYEKGFSNNIESGKADSIKKEIALLDKRFAENLIKENDYLNKKEELDLALILTGAKRDEVMLNKSGLANAINNMNRARLNLSYREIKAPFSGIVANCNLVANQRIDAGTKLFKLLDDEKFRIEVGLIESEIIHIKNGSPAKVMISSIPGLWIQGKVANINPMIDEETKTCRVTIEIPNTDARIKSGMFANVLIQAEALDNRVLVPKEALLVRDNRNLIFTAEDGIAKWKYVDIGGQNEEYIEILSGVKEGEAVITEGHYNLAHDAKIKIKK